jgi:hypothetical protein
MAFGYFTCLLPISLLSREREWVSRPHAGQAMGIARAVSGRYSLGLV